MRASTKAYEYSVKPVAAASSRSVCLGVSSSRLSYIFKPNGMAAATRSGSSSLSNVVPPDASALPTWLIAIRLSEQPDATASKRQAAQSRSEVLSPLFAKYGIVFHEERSLTVAALI